MLSHLEKPGLFVPFDDIKLLNEVSQGKEMTARLGSWGKKYQHYSTLNPIGEGLQSNTIYQDFGDKLAYFYLCGDRDAIGAYNQNKGTLNNNLYIFDQVIMPEDNVVIDSRLSLLPVGLARHTRHGQFRNRSLIEDSNFSSKFDSLFKLKEKTPEIMRLMDKIIEEHSEAIKKQRPHWWDRLFFWKVKSQKIKQLLLLKEDAQQLKQTLLDRIHKIDTILPPIKNSNNIAPHEKKDIQKQSLMLEKILNKPTLYTENGRPYRHPNTYRNLTKVVSLQLANNRIILQFNKKVDRRILRLIYNNSYKEKIWVRKDNKAIAVPKKRLKEWRKNSIFSNNDNPNIVVSFKTEELLLLKEAYRSDPSHKEFFKKFNSFNNKLIKIRNKTNPDILHHLTKLHITIDRLRHQAKNKGFICHVQKLFNYYVHQQLKSLVNVELLDDYNNAFLKAVRLDRINQFNNTCLKLLKMENDFKDFIVNCKKPLESENDGKTAIEKSSLFKQRLDETIIKAKSPLENKSKKKTKARNNKNHRVELKKMPLFFKPSKCPKPRKAHTQLANIKKSYHFTQQKY